MRELDPPQDVHQRVRVGVAGMAKGHTFKCESRSGPGRVHDVRHGADLRARRSRAACGESRPRALASSWAKNIHPLGPVSLFFWWIRGGSGRPAAGRRVKSPFHSLEMAPAVLGWSIHVSEQGVFGDFRRFPPESFPHATPARHPPSCRHRRPHGLAPPPPSRDRPSWWSIVIIW